MVEGGRKQTAASRGGVGGDPRSLGANDGAWWIEDGPLSCGLRLLYVAGLRVGSDGKPWREPNQDLAWTTGPETLPSPLRRAS